MNGVYVGVETMISGTVTSGKITKRMTTQINGSMMRVSEIKKNYQSVQELATGENGTIFTRGNAAARIKSGDVLDFG